MQTGLGLNIIASENITFDGNPPDYDNPIIPKGFMAIDTPDATWPNNWNEGLVIEDENGNQFVWVPVDGINVSYTKWCTTGISHTSTIDDTLPSGFSTTNVTTTYKGFYIARYESMFDYNDGSIRAASKKSIDKTISNWSTTRNETYSGYLWNFVNYTDSKTYAEKMDTSHGYDTSLVGTSLVTGAQWDAVMKWIQNSGKNVSDSGSWGNHSDSIPPADIGSGSLQVSGYNENWKAKNIYNLAGNLREWTNEIYNSNSYSIRRGGHYNYSSSGNPADSRHDNDPAVTYNYLGFRVALYIL